MLLKDALAGLQAGKQWRRIAWTIEDGYLSLLPGMKHIWKIVIKPTTNAGNYIFSLEDLLASDWQEFELPAESVEVL
jgi:hypothetical protein